MAGGLGGKQPFCSAKVVDVKRCRQVEVLENHETLGKNGHLCWHKDMEGKRPFASKLSVNSKRHFQPSQAASA